MKVVSTEEARRIAVRAQLLDGSATTILDTVRRLGFLQIDPISTVAPPQQLVLWSRLGPYDVAELDRLLWEEKKLFEYNAFIWPIESYPLVRARMRRRRTGKYAWERRGEEFLRANRAFKRFVLRELEQNGPMLSREIEGDAERTWASHGWWGNRSVAVLLEVMHGHGLRRSRRPQERPAGMGSRRALVPRGRVDPAARGREAPRSSASARWACGSRRRAGRHTRTPTTGLSATA